MNLDLTNLLGQLTITAITLGIAALGYSAWFASGIANAAIKTKTWSWARTFTDLGKVALAVYVVFAVVLGFNLIQTVAQVIGADISVFTSVLSTSVVAGTALVGAANFFTKAISNVWGLWKFTQIGKDEVKDDSEIDYNKVGEQTKQVIDDVWQFFTQKQENIDYRKEQEEIGGRGAYYNISINSYDVFRSSVLGKGFDVDGAYGYQCWDGTALVWQQLGRNLQTGNGCASGCWNLKRDVNAGSDFDLIWNLNDVKRGDVVVFSAGTYGHIGFADENYNGSGVIKLLGQNQGGSPKGAAGGAGFNVINMNATSFLGAFRLKKWATNDTAPANPLKDLNTIAQEVIAGKWGNDPERSEALKKAGYDAAAVQSIVNGLCAPKTTPSAPAKKVTVKEGDTVVPTKLIDYTGRSLIQYHASYTLKQLKGDRAVLYAGSDCWAALNVANIKKA